MTKRVAKRSRCVPLTKEMLLPLPTQKVQALSLENHVALAVVRSGNGDCDQVVCLLRVVYLAFFMRNETASTVVPSHSTATRPRAEPT